jgi:hypothetical protein
VKGKRLAAVTAGAALLVGLGGGGAIGAALVTSAQIKDGTIRARDINPPTVAAFKNLRGYELVRIGFDVTPDTGDWGPSYGLRCPDGKAVISGSYQVTGQGPYVVVGDEIGAPGVWSDGTKRGGAYNVTVDNQSTHDLTLMLSFVCADVGPVTVTDLGIQAP